MNYISFLKTVFADLYWYIKMSEVFYPTKQKNLDLVKPDIQQEWPFYRTRPTPGSRSTARSQMEGPLKHWGVVGVVCEHPGNSSWFPAVSFQYFKWC